MNILLVDDEILTLNDLRHSLDWEEFGIREIDTAMNIEKAKKVISEKEIDILLCDIEMPGGSGLDLQMWIRENNYDMETIILTYHPDFEYMKEAISLESSGYLLKPIDYEELGKLLEKVIRKRKSKMLLQYKRRCQLWGEVIERKIIADKRTLAQLGYAKPEFYPILFGIRWFSGELAEQQLRDFAFENIFEEITESYGFKGDIVRISRGYFAVIVSKCKNRHADVPYIAQVCETIMKLVKRFVKCNCTCYLGDETKLGDIPAFYEECFQSDKTNVSRFNTVLRKESFRKNENRASRPDMKLWESLIENGEKGKLLGLAGEYMERTLKIPGYGANELKRLYYDFLQIAYACLKKQNLDMSRLFADGQSLELCDKAICSAEDMLSWMEYVLNRIAELSGEGISGISMIEAVTAYIHANIKEDLSREGVAEKFHFCADYLDRLFRRNVGCSVSKYILNERLDIASELLAKTDLPVSQIAATIGFNKASHFSALFRRKTEMSPIEFRKKIRKA